MVMFNSYVKLPQWYIYISCMLMRFNVSPCTGAINIQMKNEKRLTYQANSKTQRNKWPSKHRSGTQDHPGIPRPSQSTSSTDPGHPSSCPKPRLSRRRFLALLLDLPLFWPCTSLSPSLKLISTSEALPDGFPLVTWQGGQDINVWSWENHPEIWRFHVYNFGIFGLRSTGTQTMCNPPEMMS